MAKYALAKHNLIVSRWPEPNKANSSKAKDFERIMVLVSQIRALNSDLGLAKPKLVYKQNLLLHQNAALIARLAKVGSLEQVEQGRGLQVPSAEFDLWVDTDAATISSYRAAIERKHYEAGEYLRRLQDELANPSYRKHAPAELVKETEERTQQAQQALKSLDEQIRRIAA